MVNIIEQSVPSGEFVTGVDGDGYFTSDQVAFQDIDFTGLFGQLMSSGTENSLAYGNKSYWLSAPYTGQKDYTLEFKTSDGNYMYGIVRAFDNTENRIDVTITISPQAAGAGIYSEWDIQIVAGPSFGIQASSTNGFSSDTITIPSLGVLQPINTDGGKLFGNGSTIIVAALDDSSQYFRGVSQAYDETAGTCEIFVTDVGPSASGTWTNFSVIAQDASGVNASLMAFSDSPQNLVNVTADVNLFSPIAMNIIGDTTNKLFAGGSIVYVWSRSDTTKNFTGYTTSGISGTNLNILPLTVNGTGTFSDWSILITSTGWASTFGPTITLNQLNLSSESGGQGITNIVNLPTFSQSGVLTLQPSNALSSKNLTLSWGTDAILTVAGTGSVSGTNTGDQTTISGNAATATKLQTARNINGVAFDGTANITVADATKVPTTTTVNGHALSSNVTVTYADLAAGAIVNGTTATTQTAADNSTKVATTAYADAAPGLVLLNTLTAASSASVADTTSITAAYNDYMIVYEGLIPAATRSMLMQYSTTAGGGSYIITNYNNTPSTVTTGIDLYPTSTVANTATNGLDGSVTIYGVNQTARRKQVIGTSSYLGSGGNLAAIVGGAYSGSTAAVTALNFIPSGAATTFSGVIKIYGIKK